MPTQVIDLEISSLNSPIVVTSGNDSAWILIRFQTLPLGWVWIDCSDSSIISVEELQWSIANQLNKKLVEGTFEASLSTETASNTFPISVVVCTRDRTQYLEGCLKNLLELDYPNFEIIVVDNAPTTQETAKLVSTMPSVRYVLEERPGLDWARNRGIVEAENPILAFTDDDACVDPHWLQSINIVFQEEEVMAVTGYVGPAELDTDAQYLFEFQYGGMGHGLNRQFFRARQLTEKQLLWASGFGVGVNMAFRCSVWDEIGNFDVALDVGTPSGGGGDIEMFHRLVAKGHTLVYEPSMLVWHKHRRSLSNLQKQFFDNGRSFGSYLLTCFQHGTVKRTTILSFFLYDWLYQWILKRLLHPRQFPRKMILIELIGMLKSPICYVHSHMHAKQTSHSNQHVDNTQDSHRKIKIAQGGI